MVYEVRTTEAGDDLLCAIESILLYDGRYTEHREVTKKVTRFGLGSFDIQAAVRMYMARGRNYKSMSMDEFIGLDMSKKAHRKMVWEHMVKHLLLGKHILMEALCGGNPTVLAILAYNTPKNQVLVNCCHRGLVYLKMDDLMCDHDYKCADYNGMTWYGGNITYLWR